MSNNQDKKDRPDDREDPRSKRSFIEHLLNQPEGPNTPRAKVEPRDAELWRRLIRKQQVREV